MILRNGINSTLRARGRSVLFTILILVLTVALTLGMGAWVYSAALLNQMDESYTSIAVIEYMGADYPNENIADVYARNAADALDSTAIRAIDGVKLWEPTDRTLANIAGYNRLAGNVPYDDYGVLICTSFVPVYESGWREFTKQELPELYITVNEQNWTAKMDDSLAGETDWLPYYHEKTEEGFLRCWYDSNGTLQESITPENEMPSEYIFRQSFSDTRFHDYLCIKGNRIESIIVETVYNNPSPYFAYFPDRDIYYGYGKYIRAYTGICVDPLYSREYSSDFLMTLVTDQQGLQIESGKRYIVHGMFSPDGNNLNNFVLVPFADGSETPSWQEITDGTYDPIFDRYAQKYAVANSYVRLESGKNIASLEVFQQNILHLESGRFPYESESGVCVISHDIAIQMDLNIGNRIDLTTLNSVSGDRFELTPEDSKTLQVVGITSSSDDYIGCVWVSDAEGGYTSPLFGYQLGHAVLDNRTARTAADSIAQLCGDNVRVTLYDQGYSAAAQPLQTMKTTAMAITLASSCAALAVLLLFAFLFVGRQKETVQVLISLGTPAKDIRLWLLSGAAVICGFSAALGAGIGGLALNKIIQLALTAASGLYVADQRFSEAAIGFVKDATTVDAAPYWPALLSGLGVFLLSLILCLVFLKVARQQNTPKRGKQKIRVPKSGTSVAGKGPLRFAILSAKRGGWRSGIVPAAALVLSLLLGILAYGAQGWEDQIDTLYRDTVICGSAVSTNGRQDTRLQIPVSSARTLWNSGQLKNVSVSLGWNYWLDDEMPDFGWGEFAEYRRQDWIGKQPELIALNGFDAAAEFMHGLSADINWLSGYDESVFTGNQYHSFMTTRFYGESGAILKQQNEEIPYPCVVTQQFLTRRGLALGEEFTVCMRFKHYPWDEERYVQLYAVGVFDQTCTKDNIYLPLSFWCDPSWINGDTDILSPGERPGLAFRSNEDRDKYLYNTTNFETCVFTLDSATQLETLRDYLSAQKFSQVRKLASNRTTVVLRDQTFVETVEGLGRYISFSKLLFPVLFAVIALLGFIISWLMINGRRMEFAILRGLGASKISVFLSFFLEQLLLCLSGCFLGVVALLIATGVGTAQYAAVAIFLACYLSGCALSVLAVGRTNLMLLLSEKE